MPAQLEAHAREYMRRLVEEGGKPLPELTIEDARRYMRESQTGTLDMDLVEMENAQVDGISVSIVRPKSSDSDLPALLYIHGGGWTLGGLDTHARILQVLALEAGVTIVVPEYSLSPEARFPIALEQCYTVAKWMQAEGAKHRIDTSRMAVAGDSAGGNLAAALALLATERGEVAFRLQVLLCPPLQASSESDSYAEFADGLNLTREAMEWFWAQYVPDREQRRNPLVSPLLADLAALSLVPPALIVTAECDVLRDDGERYAQRLSEAGVATTAVRFLGTLHNFPVIDNLQKSGASIAALHLIADALKSSLHHKA
ncbi:MAG: alpha/beta hydrolase [Bryocella sp.]